MIKPLVTTILFFIVWLPRVCAADYTVTSNADNGAGTLRDAIMQAGANAAGAPNRILFNIADLSVAGRTITISSALPLLSSSLVIDGTTQPGAAFGPTGAKIIITNPYTFYYANYFNMVSVQDVQIVGLWLQGTGGGAAFHFKSSSHLVFGAPGKGNIVSGFGYAVYCDNNLNEPGSSDVTIQNNFFGTDETGMSGRFNNIDFYVENVANLQIGGLLPGEGNLLAESSYPADIKYTKPVDFGFLHIEGNLQGTDITGNRRLCLSYSSWEIDGYNDGSNILGNTPVDIRVISNVGVGGFSFFSIHRNIIVQGNHLGVGMDGTTNLIAGSNGGNNVLLFFEFCNTALVGGPSPADKNFLAYNGNGVFEFHCGNITISRNSIFCNTAAGIQLDQSGPGAPFASITLLTTSMVGGKASPNAIIELFYDDACPGCEGKTFIGSTTADATGNWSYSIVATGAIVVTGTDTNGATSGFSKATINTDKIVVRDATCGRNNGSVKNIEVTSGTEWYWKDANGNIVAVSKDLENAWPGTYTFVSSVGGNGCEVSSAPYTIKNIPLPAFDANLVTVTQPGCGQANGAFTYTGTFDPAGIYKWILNGDTVLADYANANPFNKLAPGNYSLMVALKTDPGCRVFYDVFNLVNQSGPALSTGNVSVTNASCGKSNGGISGLTYQNAAAPLYMAWKDSAGKTVGNNIGLTGVPAGNYRLFFKDAGGCDTIVTTWFPVLDQGTISLDSSKLVIKPASCASDNGSIAGMQSINAASYSWINIAAGNTIAAGSVTGNGMDLAQMAPGVYQLQLTNALGCNAASNPIAIAQIPSPAFNTAGLQIINDTCNAGTGGIRGVNTVDKALIYTWAWYAVDANSQSINPSFSSNPSNAAGLHAGNYEATITDPSGCSTTSKPFTIVNIDASLADPAASDQFIPRNTATVIQVIHPQTGRYQLLDGNSANAQVLDSSTTGILHTPVVTADKTFYLLLTRGDCVSSYTPVNIKVFDSTRIFVPNSFSPNGDGINDRWHIVVQGVIKQIHIAVYDRFGIPVYSAADPVSSWDGRYHGQRINGTFVYLVEGVDYYNRPFKVKGAIVVLR